MIWYKFHIGDYLTHTVHLSDAEDLAYRRLMDLYYMSEKAIPLDTESVARKIRLDLDITESVLGEFFEHTENGYYNHRCHVEIAKYQHQVANNRQLGKRGGRPLKTESVSDSSSQRFWLMNVSGAGSNPETHCSEAFKRVTAAFILSAKGSSA